tara:strand:+ start:8958 stop:11939 length:2982 start_codon:yes stop_codon:yes gene_type:complete
MDISKFALNAGELTDELAGRIDLGKVQMGLSVAENVRVLRVGGVTRRAGTGYIAPVFDETKKSRLEGFRFAENQGVCLEFAHNRMRVFKDAAIQDTLDLTESQTLTGTINPTELVTPWTEDQVFALQFAQRIEGILVTHPDVPTQFLQRDAGGFWSIQELPWAERVWEISDDGADINMQVAPALAFSSFILSFALYDFATDGADDRICLVAHTPENSADGFLLPNWTTWNDPIVGTEEIALDSYWQHDDAVYKALVFQAAGGNDDPTEDPAKWVLLANIPNTLATYVPSIEIPAGSLISEDDVVWLAEVNVTPTLEVGGYGGLPETGASWTEVSGDTNTGYLLASADIFTSDWVGTHVRLAHTRPENPFRSTPNTQGALGALFNASGGTYVVGDIIYMVSDGVRSTGRYAGLSPVGNRQLWTVIADYDGAGGDYETGDLDPDQYPTFFAQGAEMVPSREVLADWTFETFDTWTGTYVVERSYDAGVSWNPVKTLQSSNDKNFLVQDVEQSDAGATFKVLLLDLQNTQINVRFAFTTSAVQIYGVVNILSYNSATQVFVSIERPVESNLATSEWYEDAFNPKNGYAKACTFHQSRLFLGGSHARPQSVWASRVRAPFNFSIGTLADDGLSFELEAREYESVQWLNSHLALLVGTSAGVWAIASPNGKSITAENNVTTKQISHGVSAGVPPIALQSNVLFLQNKGRKIHELSSGGSIEYGSYTGVDLTQLASHITAGGVTQFAGGAVPDSSLYVVTGGEIALLTYERSQNVVGWSRWVTQGAFESVAVCPGGGEDDDVYVTVKRGTRRFIERLTPDMLRVEETGDMVNLNFVDSSVRKVEVVEFTTMDGLDHLEGETVQVFADGEKKGDLIVTSGAVTVPHGVLNMIVGLGYDSIVTTMPLDQGQIGRKSAFTKAIIRLRHSLGLVALVGDDAAESKVHIANPRITADAPLPLLSGDGEVTLHSSWTRSPTITLKQSDPLPMTILAIRMVSKTSP